MIRIYFPLFVPVIIFCALVISPTLGFAQVMSTISVSTNNPNSVNASFVSNLGFGSRGAEVTALQTYLASRLDIYPEGLITGYFGRATERAVKRLQAENNLDQVGRLGPKTRVLLNRLIKEGRATGNSKLTVPQIMEVFATSTSPNSAYVFWTTNKFTTAEFWYATTSPVSASTSPKVSHNNKSFSHSNSIQGLSTSTDLYYVIKVTDERGNSATSTERVVRTISE